MNSNSYSYSHRGEWLGGESSKRSYHKDGSIFLMTAKGINPVCDSSWRVARESIISPQAHSFTSLTIEHVSG